MRCFLSVLVVLATVPLHAAEVRRIPPPGVAIPAADRAELQVGVEALGKEIEGLRKELDTKPQLLALLPDVQIFHKAVDWALRYDEFMDAKEVPKAKALLAVGLERAKALRAGEAPWNAQTGLVVRGYHSKIDDSVQPYGLLIPDDFKPGEKTPRRLDFWCHGRGEKLTELAFIDGSMHSKGEFASGFTTPGIVCFLYGRFCNANKFAGEYDLFEAFTNIGTHYPIDSRQLVIRGFSMGGASTWQFATHHPGMWAAAAPGAGFAETAEFFHVFAEGKTPPPWWEQVLWRWYDCTTMAANLANTSVVAYSGEIDGQKQAADIMVKYAKQEGLNFPHIIGPQTAHKYHPESQPKIEELVTEAVEKGQNFSSQDVRLTTYSLLYDRAKWIQVLAMEQEWERADISARATPGRGLAVETKNISAFEAKMLWGPNHVTRDGMLDAVIDGTSLRASIANGTACFVKRAGKWEVSSYVMAHSLKRGGLCGPIDHAFMSHFVFVRPTGKPLNDAIGAWTMGEMEHAIAFWRRVFRGEASVKDDTAITEHDIQNANLILWGDPSSNRLLARALEVKRNTDPEKVRELLSADKEQTVVSRAQAIMPPLPLRWDSDTLTLSAKTYAAADHVPILIFPNPLNPRRYIVLNSGPTFREEALLNNSDQTPKLPDWAVVNIDTPPDGKWPGQIIDAGFFDEQWALPKN